MTEVRVLATADVPADLLRDVRALLDRAFGDGFEPEDWDHALGGQHVLVLDDDGALVAHAAVVERWFEAQGRRWRAGSLEAVATEPSRQREGFGARAVARAGDLVRAGYELGELSTGVHGFYERLGWERWQGPTSVRRATGIERTEDEDDGIMVLRTGPSARLDLAVPIACDERPGDDW